MWFLHPPKSRRRWHVFTWLAAVPALVFVGLVQVAGLEVEGPPELLTPVPRWYLTPLLQSVVTSTTYPQLAPEFATQIQALPVDVEEHLHGWPTPWLRRASGYGTAPLYDVNGSKKQPLRWPAGSTKLYKWHWQDPAAWPWAADNWQVAPLGLALNFLVAAAIVAGVMMAAEVWIRRRGGPFRFRLLDIGIAATLIVAALGLWKLDRRAVQREAEIVERFHATQNASNKVETSYIGPDWLARLMGGEQHVPILRRATHLRIGSLPDNRLDVAPLKSLQHLETVSFHTWLRDEQVVLDLRYLPDLQEWVITPDYRGPLLGRVVRSLCDHPGIEKLSIESPTLAEDLGSLVGDKDLQTLEVNTDLLTGGEFEDLRSRLGSVVTVSTSDVIKPPCQIEQIEAARITRRARGSCRVSHDGRSLLVAFIPFDEEHLARLSSLFSRVEELELMGRAIPSGGTELVAQMESLTEVNLCVSEVPEEFLAELATSARLRRVIFDHGNPSFEALMRFAEIPDCRVVVDVHQFTEEEIKQLEAAFGDRLQSL